MSDDEVIALPAPLVPFAIRMADEGIPVLAIARSLRQPAEEVRESLHDALHSGAITEIPRPDWPPTARRADRLPTAFTNKIDDDGLFRACRRVFKVTRLQATVFVVLLRKDHAEKETLHNAIERGRFSRQSKPHNMEATDPKMVDVVICVLRKKLKMFDIAIKTSWGNGYYMEPTDRKKAMLMIREFTMNTADLGEEYGEPGVE